MNVISSKYFKIEIKYLNGANYKTKTSTDFRRCNNAWNGKPTAAKAVFKAFFSVVNGSMVISLDSKNLSQAQADEIVAGMTL